MIFDQESAVRFDVDAPFFSVARPAIDPYAGLEIGSARLWSLDVVGHCERPGSGHRDLLEGRTTIGDSLRVETQIHGLILSRVVRDDRRDYLGVLLDEEARQLEPDR